MAGFAFFLLFYSIIHGKNMSVSKKWPWNDVFIGMHTIWLPPHHWVRSGSGSSPLTNLQKKTCVSHNTKNKNNCNNIYLWWEKIKKKLHCLEKGGSALRQPDTWSSNPSSLHKQAHTCFIYHAHDIIQQGKYHLQTILCIVCLSTSQTLWCNSVIKNRSMTASFGSTGAYAYMRWCMTTGINGLLFKENRQKVRLREN